MRKGNNVTAAAYSMRKHDVRCTPAGTPRAISRRTNDNVHVPIRVQVTHCRYSSAKQVPSTEGKACTLCGTNKHLVPPRSPTLVSEHVHLPLCPRIPQSRCPYGQEGADSVCPRAERSNSSAKTGACCCAQAIDSILYKYGLDWECQQRRGPRRFKAGAGRANSEGKRLGKQVHTPHGRANHAQ